jgi:predicted aspartyl protease
VPILHTQFLGQAQTPDGQVIQIPPPVALQQRGPCLQASVSVAESIAKQLLQRGQAVPPPISGAALIDTGASVTCIDDDAAQQLKLPVVDVVTIGSASHAAHQANVYPISIDIAGLPIAINAPRAVGAALTSQGLLLLIGRDVLQFCTLFYNGTTGEITLSM